MQKLNHNILVLVTDSRLLVDHHPPSFLPPSDDWHPSDTTYKTQLLVLNTDPRVESVSDVTVLILTGFYSRTNSTFFRPRGLFYFFVHSFLPVLLCLLLALCYTTRHHRHLATDDCCPATVLRLSIFHPQLSPLWDLHHEPQKSESDTQTFVKCPATHLQAGMCITLDKEQKCCVYLYLNISDYERWSWIWKLARTVSKDERHYGS